MATRYDPCPTCTTQIATNYCDNCRLDLPQGASPAVTGRVWNPNLQGYVGIDLCETCTSQNVNLLAVVTAPNSEPDEVPGSEPEEPPVSQPPSSHTPVE